MEYKNVSGYLDHKGIDYILEGKEVRIECPFCHNPKKKCYVENSTGLYYCHHCGEGGQWKGLVERLGDNNASVVKSAEVSESEEIDLPPIDPEIIKENHQRLLGDIGKPLRDWLHNRGLTDETIARFKLGWDGKSVTIPVYDANGDCHNFRLRRDPTLPIPTKGLYSIPQRGRKRLFNEIILKQQLETVIICEGEWDCMLLNQLGFPAVTSTTGAQSFDEEWVKTFVQIKNIYICFDNDRNGAGQKGTIKTAQLFYKNGKAVKIVHLPDPGILEEKVDVTDYFVKRKATKEQFTELLNIAEIYIPELTPIGKDLAGSPVKPISLKELMGKVFPKIEWVVERLIPSESVVAISGVPSAYKTWLVLDLAIRVTKGDVLFDKFITNQTGVLIIDEETGQRWLQQRIVKLQDTYDLPIYLLSKTGFRLTNESVKQIISFAKQNKVGLVVFDSLLRIHVARDENNAVEMAQVFRLFQKLTKEGIAVIFTQHNRKLSILRSPNPSQEMRGSSDILAAVDCHLAIERKDDFLTVTQTKLRQGEEIHPFKLNIMRGEDKLRLGYAGETDEIKTKKDEFKNVIKEILEESGRPLYQKELFETVIKSGAEGGYSTFESAIKEMIEKEELFENRGHEKNKVFYSLRPFNLIV